MTDQEISFPRLRARTARFTLGEPRSFTVAADGSRVAFLRSESGTDRTHALWILDVATGTQRCVADPRRVLEGAEELSAAERARRERSREQGAGIVAYATDRELSVASFALSGSVCVADLEGGIRSLPSGRGALDPRIDPFGRHVAYAADAALRVTEVDGSGDRALAEPESATQAWGVAEFVAAEEMGRSRGFWWAPDGGSLLVERYDEAAVQVWYVADPANPDRPPAAQRYPAAGTANAEVSLWHVTLDGRRREIPWDHDALPYLNAVSWTSAGDPLVQVQSRDQRRVLVFAAAVAGLAPQVETVLVSEQTDPAWVELVPGTPARLPDGRVLTTLDEDDTRRLAVDGKSVSPPGLQVRAILDVETSGAALVSASIEQTEVHVFRITPDGATTMVSSGPGVHGARSAAGTTVLTSRSLSHHGARTTVSGPDGAEVAIESRALRPPFLPAVRLAEAGERHIPYAVLLPRDHVPGSRPLPVVLDPYGGPGAQRVLASAGAFLEAQWLADQGFAVVVADGRGTPGRGPSWERAIRADLATPVLEDQVEALRAAAAQHSDLDLTRVGIRGWSFGGYLAALAVLRRPDVFHAAVAGAPVTDWRLYDTHYTERYLGDPTKDRQAYDASSLIADAAALRHPLLIVHGLADDNVVVAHSLRLSQALLEAGRAHQVLPLSGVTHMTPQEVVAENLLLLQVEFLRSALAVVPG